MSSFHLIRWAWVIFSNSAAFFVSRSSLSSHPYSTHNSSLSRRRRWQFNPNDYSKNIRFGKQKFEKNTSSTSKAFWSCWRMAASLSAFSFRSCCCMWLNRRRWTWHSSINLSSSISINFWIAFHWFCSLMQLSNSSARRRFFLSRSSRSLRFSNYMFTFELYDTI